MPHRVVITRQLPSLVEDRAHATYDVIHHSGENPLRSSEFARLCQGADALLPCVADHLPTRNINGLPGSIRIIANFGVGLDHIDLNAARARGITVTNTPRVLTEATAEVAILLMLGAARRAKEGMAEIAQGTWQGWSPTHLLGTGLTGKRLGIVGMGRIGTAVARRAQAFGMKIHCYQRHCPDGEDLATYHDTLAGLLGVADVLMLTCSATDETRHMINAAALAQLPKGAIVVNPARGDLVVDDDLVAALKSGHIAAAGLDVFDGEPAVHPLYRAMPQVFALPHLGSATEETRTAMGMMALDNLDAFFAGLEPPNKVTPTN